jgi:hypothetical protein
MSASRYPRPGSRIAPVALREILDFEVADVPLRGSYPPRLRFCDLDERSWTHFTAGMCRELARAVVRLTVSRFHSLPAVISSRHLPPVPEIIDFDNLQVEVRTRNCLARLSKTGVAKSPADLRNLTIGQVSELRAFGAKSLVDLLTSLEAVSPEIEISPATSLLTQASPSSTTLDRNLTREARKLRDESAAKDIYFDDPRLAKFFGSFARASEILGVSWSLRSHRSLHDIAEQIAARNRDPIDAKALTQEIRAIRRCILQLSQTKLEKELKDLVTVVSGERTAKIVGRYLGWDGLGACTLQTVGNEQGLTRERVRQICSRFLERLPKNRPYLPALDRALRLVEARLPRPARDIEEAFARRGLANQPFRLEGIISAARVMNRRVNFRIEALRNERFVTPEKAKGWARDILRTARRSVSRWGIATVVDIMEQVNEKHSPSLEFEFVSGVLQTMEDFAWLDRESGWFWLSSVPRNHLTNLIAKVLVVSSQIRVGDLRTGISRDARTQGFAPPRRVLLELCRQLPICRVEDEVIFGCAQVDKSYRLNNTETLMCKILNKNGPLLERARFLELCEASDINSATFTKNLASSPVISRYAPGVYGIIGAQFPPGLIDSMLKRRRPSRVLQDYGWTDDRKVWITYKLSSGIIRNGVMTVPASVASFLQGEFALRDGGGSRVGTITSKGNQAWGLIPFFSRRGGEPGDSLLLVFDLSSRDVHVSVGDETLLDLETGESPTTAIPSSR